MGVADEPTDACDAWVDVSFVFVADDGSGGVFGVLDHTPEFVDGKRLAEFCGPLLTIQHGTGRVDLNRHGDDHNDGKCTEQRDACKGDVEQPLHDSFLPVPGFEVDVDEVPVGTRGSEYTIRVIPMHLHVDAVVVAVGKGSEKLPARWFAEGEDGGVDVVVDEDLPEGPEVAEDGEHAEGMSAVGDRGWGVGVDVVGAGWGDEADEGEVGGFDDVVDFLGVVADDDGARLAVAGAAAERDEPRGDGDEGHEAEDDEGGAREAVGVVEVPEGGEREKPREGATRGERERVEDASRARFEQRGEGDEERADADDRGHDGIGTRKNLWPEARQDGNGVRHGCLDRRVVREEEREEDYGDSTRHAREPVPRIRRHRTTPQYDDGQHKAFDVHIPPTRNGVHSAVNEGATSVAL